MNIIWCLLGMITVIEGVVLDPALYLSPSPPLTTSHNNDAQKLWSQTLKSRVQDTISKTTSTDKDTMQTSTESPETMEGAETFWPIYRPASLRGIHVPLTLHLSGTYGGNSGTGVLTSGYMGIADDIGSRVKSGLAGSSYKSYGSRPGMRIYGSDTKPAWGGWGNGKWGNYGKG